MWNYLRSECPPRIPTTRILNATVPFPQPSANFGLSGEPSPSDANQVTMFQLHSFFHKFKEAFREAQMKASFPPCFLQEHSTFKGYSTTRLRSSPWSHVEWPDHWFHCPHLVSLVGVYVLVIFWCLQITHVLVIFCVFVLVLLMTWRSGRISWSVDNIVIMLCLVAQPHHTSKQLCAHPCTIHQFNCQHLSFEFVCVLELTLHYMSACALHFMCTLSCVTLFIVICFRNACNSRPLQSPHPHMRKGMQNL